MGNTPAFQYYPADLLADPEVMFWDMEQVGCYWQMITFLWLNEGKFEYNIDNLCKLFRTNHKKTSEKLWKNIEKKFVFENGVITHKRVTKEIKKQSAKRIARQEAGRKGGMAKAENSSNATILPLAKPSTSSSSSSSSSSLVTKRLTASDSNADDSVFYTSKKKRKLSGDKLEWFEHFWEAFNLKKGKAEAADSWLDIQGLNRNLAAVIYKAAQSENIARASLKNGSTPKWGQGWLSGRRWEDESSATNNGQSSAQKTKDRLNAKLT